MKTKARLYSTSHSTGGQAKRKKYMFYRKNKKKSNKTRPGNGPRISLHNQVVFDK